MATQTRSKRQAAAKKGAATRKANATKRSATTTKSSARGTGRSVKSSAQSGRRTAGQAARTTGRGLDTASTRFEAFGRQAQRAVLIQLGLAVALRDAISEVAETYTNLDKVIRELNRFERRGEGAVRGSKQTLRRRRREIEHDVRSAQRDVKRQTNGLRSDAEDIVGRIKNLG
jgi:hypothetical protein